MPYNLDKSWLFTELDSLRPSHRVAFCAACCERLLPLYVAFCRMESWGTPAKLRIVLDMIWSYAGGESFGQELIHQHQRTCIKAAPDSEKFTTAFVSGAIQTSEALYAALACCDSSAVSAAVGVAEAAFNAVYLYLYVTCDPIVESHTDTDVFHAWVLNSPLMGAELEKQIKDIELLKSNPCLSKEFLVFLRDSSIRSGIRPFDRGLVKVNSTRRP